MDSLHTYEPICKDRLGDFEAGLIEKHRRQMLKEFRSEIARRDRREFEHAQKACLSTISAFQKELPYTPI